MFVCSAKQGGTQEIGVVNLNPQGAQWITEAGDSIAISPVKLAKDVLRSTRCHLQTLRVPTLLIGVDESTGDETRADQIRGPGRNYDGTSLPRKTVTPAPVTKTLRPKRNDALDHLLDETFLVKQSNFRKV